MLAVVTSELTSCFGKDYETATAQLSGHFIHRDRVDFNGTVLVFEPRNKANPPLYLVHATTDPYEWSVQKGRKDKIEWIYFYVGVDPRLHKDMVR